MSLNRRIVMTRGSAPCVRIWFVRLRQEQIADGEHEVPRAPITDRNEMSGAQSIEGGDAHAEEGEVEAFRGLAAVRMRDQQIAVLGVTFQVFQVADLYLFRPATVPGSANASL